MTNQIKFCLLLSRHKWAHAEILADKKLSAGFKILLKTHDIAGLEKMIAHVEEK